MEEENMYKHHKLVPLLLTILLLLSSLGYALAQEEPPDQKGLEIENLITEIQKGLANAQMGLRDASIPLLTSVTLDLIAEAKVEKNGTINLFIVTIGKRWEKILSQEIKIKLIPPLPPPPESMLTKGGIRVAIPSVSDQLTAAIISAGKGVQKAGSNSALPLVASKFEVTLKFGLTRTMTGEINFQILPFTVAIGADAAKTSAQTITVTYGTSD